MPLTDETLGSPESNASRRVERLCLYGLNLDSARAHTPPSLFLQAPKVNAFSSAAMWRSVAFAVC